MVVWRGTLRILGVVPYACSMLGAILDLPSGFRAVLEIWKRKLKCPGDPKISRMGPALRS
jgi:hypothetical protein